MTEIRYTDPAQVTDTRTTETPRSGQTASGYGRQIPTSRMICYAGRWHRVYVMVYGNAGSPYIVKGGATLHLDTWTEHLLSD